jgi:TonB-linked SusC/RagA family outer membrane protein
MRKVILALLVSMAFAFGAHAQKTVTGKVTDADGKPVPNVSVVVKGTSSGTTTDAGGNYSIQVPANGKVLEFSSLGFVSQSLSIGNKSVFSPVLTSSDAKELAEVVVTGFSKVKKAQYSGASTKIGEKEIKNQPTGSFDQILQGKVPGVIALTGSGAPGTSANVIIRGSQSIILGSSPLYVVDGIQVEQGVFQALNPNDFASIDVLRDAASAAAYGNRGSAGVIVVTTKRGSAGKVKFSYSGQMGVKSKPDFGFRPMNTAELLNAQNEFGKIVAQGNASAPVSTNPDLPGFFYSADNPRYAALSAAEKAENARLLDSIRGINTNWSDQIFRSANFSNHQLSLSGGNEKVRFYSSLAMYNEEGITLRTDMKRVTLRNNLDITDNKLIFSVSSNLGYVSRNFQQSTVTNNLGNPFLTSAVNVPYAKVYDEEGNFATGIGAKYSAANQLDLTKYDENYNNQLKATLGLTIGYKITNNFSAGITTGVDFRETQASNFGNPQAFTRRTSTSITGKAGFQNESLTRFLTGSVRPNVTYKKLFKEKHDVEVNVFGEYITEISRAFNARGYFPAGLKTPNTMAGTVQGNAGNQLYAIVGGGKSRNTSMAALSTARYTYLNKYTFTGSFREDESSLLPEKTRRQSFYSVGGIWEASKEDFIKTIRTINTLRLKASYGTTGNLNNLAESLGDYPWQPRYNQGNTVEATPGLANSTPGNPELKWEKTYYFNLGIDFELLNRRLWGDFNWYDKKTKDVLIPKTLTAPGAGFAEIPVNAGTLSNKGVEMTLNADVLRKKDITITVFANAAYNKNKVVSLAGEQAIEQGTEYVTEGLPLGSHYEVRWAGVDAATGSPLYYDINGNIVNVYNSSDRVQTFGTWEAPWKGGFGANIKYKGFELATLFSWQRGANKVDNMEYFTENPVGFLGSGYNQSSDLHFWTQPGDAGATTPSPLYPTSFSSKIIHDASFMRLREISLSYAVPSSMLKKLKYVSNVRAYVQGNNLAIWTKWRGRDPEAGATNINLSEFPNPRTITAGFDITF